MNRKFFGKGIFLLSIFVFLVSFEKPQVKEIIWKINSTSGVGGNTTTTWGNPRVIESKSGKAVEFNGKTDGLLVDENPLSGMEEFTIEIEINPYKGFPENREQRFLHIQDPADDNRRILIELRLNDRNEWYGDWFIKSGEESLTLIDSTSTHPVGEWATIGLAYKNGDVTGYINGNEEVRGNIQYQPIGPKGKTSIGTRMDQRSWFKGAIREIRFRPKG